MRCVMFAISAFVVGSQIAWADAPSKDADAVELVRQLGSKKFAEREAAEAPEHTEAVTACHPRGVSRG